VARLVTSGGTIYLSEEPNQEQFDN
jgi:hypothetical protein